MFIAFVKNRDLKNSSLRFRGGTVFGFGKRSGEKKWTYIYEVFFSIWSLPIGCLLPPIKNQ